MKNVENYSLKKCIFMSLEDFEDLVKEITNQKASVQYEYDGIFIETNHDYVDLDEEIYESDVLQLLSEYFDVEVTSFHADDCDYLCVWIVYKENNE